MANSRIPGVAGSQSSGVPAPDDARGPCGMNPDSRGRDSPGSLGVNDWAAYVQEALVTAHVYWVDMFTGSPSGGASVVSKCACNRELTLDELCKVYTNQKRAVCESFLPLLNKTFKSYKIDSCLGKAHFLAQVGHESGELKYMAEGLKKGVKEADVYDGYKGRGLVQLTWKKNYENYGKAVKHDFTGDNRVDLEKPEWATDSAGWYWTTHGKDLDDFATKNDLLAITALVNGGFNGFDDRAKKLKAALHALGVRECNVVKVGQQDYLPFNQSAIYKEMKFSFGWGAWNDPNAHKEGIAAKSAVERKAGYARFIELKKEHVKNFTEEQKKKFQTRKSYQFTGDEMDKLAADGSK